jgi:hypothetical protein
LGGFFGFTSQYKIVIQPSLIKKKKRQMSEKEAHLAQIANMRWGTWEDFERHFDAITDKTFECFIRRSTASFEAENRRKNAPLIQMQQPAMFKRVLLVCRHGQKSRSRKVQENKPHRCPARIHLVCQEDPESSSTYRIDIKTAVSYLSSQG